MKISFANGEEECETCLEFEEHINRDKKCYGTQSDISDVINKLINKVECKVQQCNICESYSEHLERANVSRLEYSNEANVVTANDTSLQAVDMQKVIMLPRMPGVKRAVFTKRIVAFNMTFAPLGVCLKG